MGKILDSMVGTFAEDFTICEANHVTLESRSTVNSKAMPLSRRLDRCDRVIQNECRHPFGGNVYYDTIQITFLRANSGMGNVICIVT